MERESDLLFHLNFLQREIERQERSRRLSREGATADDFTSAEKCSPIAAVLHASVEIGRTTCELYLLHALDPCFNVTKAPVGDRSTRHAKTCGGMFPLPVTAKGHAFRK